MPYPTLVTYATEAEYRAHFEQVYCQGAIATFDGIAVRFRKSQFDHCFFESTKRDGNKDSFSAKRAERIDWIKVTLEDAAANYRVGWLAKKKKHDRSRRVAIVQNNYVVVIALKKSDTEADFVTAFVADTPETLNKLLNGPVWA